MHINRFLHFCSPATLTFLDSKYPSPVISAHCYVSTIFEVSVAFLLELNWRQWTVGCIDKWTDRHMEGVQCLMWPPREGHILNNLCDIVYNQCY